MYSQYNIYSRQTIMIIVLVMTFLHIRLHVNMEKCVECRQIITESQEINKYDNITSNPAILNPIQYVFIAFTLVITMYGV